ncbi:MULTISPECIES: alpha-amylase family glycosyl hydrolase [Desulfococcus]|jgi:1,4-alpha-glucan branching enzyme|uniref:Alpha amylase catalytic region n=1 Tax=Desulfococcus multivorans DSM 2059 TaxID=1121405 RepID=S7URA8_DESML|nr:alpha-amylase family glycosyl hydrolase [Desulfococcus multivorans]AOY58189.1 alpha-amylase [Desulfococcus multivorans]AQV02921.2 alpha-amlyase [Desulfococcus multivorans]EPR34828.1 alpha amylase catalytic region [Desulfococcus multivorans DSM 2059]MDX9819973.1 alpha-amylase family glycosyl hydrolase [Desulfococcus multivorans]SJZ96184.1 1,4-alpha-glucan branching enzyme [Desulfococcus multivorans DSM 2059]
MTEQMTLLPLHRLGPRETSPRVVNFSILMPWISADSGYRMWVKIIHEHDQFLQEIAPERFEMTHGEDPDYGDIWRAEVDIGARPKAHAASRWGEPGKYVYRYLLEHPDISGDVDWIIDPFAREFGVGKLSAITIGYVPYQWSEAETHWTVPILSDLVLYELMISEFGGDIDRTIDRLDYLADLGINGIEIMPVSNTANTVDWGFLPIGYFGVDERFGNRKNFQRLIDAAHQRGIAVILDAVYGHTSESFPYSYLYRRLGFNENPFMGSFAKNYFGESTDFRHAFTRNFFFTVNHHWLDCYHIDGFRYDCVPNYWDGPMGQGYAALVYHTFQHLKAKTAEGGHWRRFAGDEGIRLIQCAEQLEAPREILETSYSTCTWQNETLEAARRATLGNPSDLESLGLRFGLFQYPTEVTSGGDSLAKSALQYIENHDHSRFVCNFGILNRDRSDLLSEGDRGLWFKTQPYLIGLMTAKGIPMIWQGQEFAENYAVPEHGWGRILMFRPVRWDYFYDPIGKRVISLVRKLIRIRRNRIQMRCGEHYFYNHFNRYQSKGVMLFARCWEAQFSLVALNFGDQEQRVSFSFPFAGDYIEELHGEDNLANIAQKQVVWLTVPSNYGRIWTIVTAE